MTRSALLVGCAIGLFMGHTLSAWGAPWTSYPALLVFVAVGIMLGDVIDGWMKR